MIRNLEKYGQYKNDLFKKADFDFQYGKKILDIGCGEGSDAEIFIQEFGLDVYGTDVYEDKKMKLVKNLKFCLGSIFSLPFADNSFDYVFVHDVLHHIDEVHQSEERHLAALKELKRVCRREGYILIIEGNRFNPLFYPHMVLYKGHNHFRQGYFTSVVKNIFPYADFKFFECHSYPKRFLGFWKVYEAIMERFRLFRPFLSYNVAIVKLQ